MKPNEMQGWIVRGDLPEFAPRDGIPARTLDALDEDLLQVVQSPGVYRLDIGWYPSNDATGAFRCRVIRADLWDAPAEEYETNDPIQACEWLSARMRDIALEFGEPGRFGEPIGFAVIERDEQLPASHGSTSNPESGAAPLPHVGSQSRMRIGVAQPA